MAKRIGLESTLRSRGRPKKRFRATSFLIVVSAFVAFLLSEIPTHICLARDSDEIVLAQFAIADDGNVVLLPITLGNARYSFLMDTGATKTTGTITGKPGNGPIFGPRTPFIQGEGSGNPSDPKSPDDNYVILRLGIMR
jgi:hypothetical protein